MLLPLCLLFDLIAMVYFYFAANFSIIIPRVLYFLPKRSSSVTHGEETPRNIAYRLEWIWHLFLFVFSAEKITVLIINFRGKVSWWCADQRQTHLIIMSFYEIERGELTATKCEIQCQCLNHTGPSVLQNMIHTTTLRPVRVLFMRLHAKWWYPPSSIANIFHSLVS